jgi:hypothetical protein
MSTQDLFDPAVPEVLPKTAAIRFQLDQLEQSLKRGDHVSISNSFENLESAISELRNRIESQDPETQSICEKDLWNEMARKSQLSTVTKLTDSRRKHLRARRKDKKWSANFAKALELIPQISFLLGRNDRGWKADFDWLIGREDSVVRILEGKYSGGSRTQNTGDVRAQIRALEETLRLHVENREGPNYRTGHSTQAGRQEFAQLKHSLGDLRAKLQTTGA